MSYIHKHIRICLSICAVLLALCGCHERFDVFEEGPATLKLTLSAPGSSLSLRSISSDPDSPDMWTQSERAADGRYLYRVTAFVLKGNKLVAHCDVHLEGEPDEAVLDFDTNFSYGEYTLMVVANYSALQDFNETVESILSRGQIENFTTQYADSFINYKLRSSGGICAPNPQPLTLVKTIELHPGENEISGELIRTYSRVRISVENNSDEQLKVTFLSFCNIFTQSSAYLFAGKGYLNDRVAINVTSADALTPFTGTNAAPMVIPSKEKYVVFDAYILESQRKSSSESYSYTLGLGYGNKTAYTLQNKTAINRTAKVFSGYYLMYHRGSKYLTVGESAPSAVSSTALSLVEGMTLPEEYVWKFDNTNLGANQYYVGPADGRRYISSLTYTSAALESARSTYFTVAEKSSGATRYLTFLSSPEEQYLYVNGQNVTGWYNDGSNAQFQLYPVTPPTISGIDIPLRTINNSTGQAEAVNEISRNDFINAIVKVSYSENQGQFSYEVLNWETGGGDVSFN